MCVSRLKNNPFLSLLDVRTNTACKTNLNKRFYPSFDLEQIWNYQTYDLRVMSQRKTSPYRSQNTLNTPK